MHNKYITVLKDWLWPVKKEEHLKVFALSAFMFCTLFNQSVLRILKDSILIPNVSVEAASFTKLYFVTPAAAIFIIIYANLVNNFSFLKLYVIISSFFSIVFVIYAFFLYPNISYFHPSANFCCGLVKSIPNLKWYIAIIANWSHVLFYVLSELWPNIFFSLLCWQFINSLTKSKDAKRLYTIFALFGNSALIFAGSLMSDITSSDSFLRKLLPSSNIHGERSIQIAIVIFVIFSVLANYLVYFSIKNISSQDNIYITHKDKTKLNIKQSLKYISTSKYLWLILICTAAFGFTMNLIESVWKDQIKQVYPSVEGFMDFNSRYIAWTGVAILIFTILGNNIMRRSSSWKLSALLTPVVILITGVGFFALVMKKQSSYYLLPYSSVMLALAVGTVQNVLSKGMKYAIWDSAKEMLYIPLDQELKTKGKAAVDILSSKFGKSLSGLLQVFVFTVFPYATYHSISWLLFLFFSAVVILWILAINSIDKEYSKLSVED